ncbi:MAG: DUF4249 family protein [Bacteroidota bacterium]|nr:DUF4249 family protein [Bacteroidota bacterium]
MKTKIYIILLSLLVLLSFSSCEYEIDYKGNLPEDKFVFFTFIEENDSIRMTIMHSAKPGVYVDFTDDDIDENFDRYSVFAQNTEVTLWVNGTLKEKKTQEKYPEIVFDYLPQHNDEITLRVENNKYPTIEHSLRLDFLPTKVDSFYAYNQRLDGEDYIVVYLTMEDDGEENYYMFVPNMPVNRNAQKVLYESAPNTYMANSLGVDFFEGEDMKYNHFGLFSNKNFKGKKYTLKLAYLYDSWAETTMDYNFEIRKIDKNAYNYLQTLSNILDYDAPVMNPITLQDAFKDAYGFISKKKTITLPVYINEL